MKFHLQLILLKSLTTIIMATPVTHQSTDLESRQGINGDAERYAVEFGHEFRLAKRATPVCSANCGM